MCCGHHGCDVLGVRAPSTSNEAKGPAMNRKPRLPAVLLAIALLMLGTTATRVAAAPAPFIVGSDGQTVVFANGDVYQYVSLPQWSYFNNIFASSGRLATPDNVPVATDGHSIITSKGDWFEWAGQWVWNNNVFESSGTVANPLDPIVGGSFAGPPSAFTQSGEWFTWGDPWSHIGNLFSGAVVTTGQSSWGAVKARKR